MGLRDLFTKKKRNKENTEIASEKKISLYEYIKSHCVDGVLPDTFSLPQEEETGKIRFADGAMDGMLMYHTMGTPLDESGRAKMQELVQLISDASQDSGPKVQAADVALLAFMQDHRALSVIDEVQGYIRENSAKLNAPNIYHYGLRQVLTSDNKECVKFGLELLELFTLKEERAKEAVRTLGLSDEFTLFSLFIMMQWENGNDEIFELAKKVNGWGKVHAVERLEPATEEIKDWLLKEGIKNQILPEYSALVCFEKAEVEKRLLEKAAGDIAVEEFQSISSILSAMLSEGPMEGISAVENRHDVLTAYLGHAKVFSEKDALELADYEDILSIKRYADDDKVADAALSETCKVFFEQSGCRKTVEEALTQGLGIELAKVLGLDYRKALWECLRNQFEENYYKVSYLLDEEAYVEPVMNLFAEKLPLETMATGPADEIGLGPEFENYKKLLFVIQNLHDKPNVGKELLKVALNALVVNNRNMAVTVLASWTEMLEKPLKEIAPDIYEVLISVIEREVREDVKTRMQELL